MIKRLIYVLLLPIIMILTGLEILILLIIGGIVWIIKGNSYLLNDDLLLINVMIKWINHE